MNHKNKCLKCLTLSHNGNLYLHLDRVKFWPYVKSCTCNLTTHTYILSHKLVTYHMSFHRSNHCSLLCYHKVDDVYSILHLNGMHIHQGICYSPSHLNLTCSPFLHYNAESHCWNSVSLDPCMEFHLDQSMVTLQWHYTWSLCRFWTCHTDYLNIPLLYRNWLTIKCWIMCHHRNSECNP